MGFLDGWPLPCFAVISLDFAKFHFFHVGMIKRYFCALLAQGLVSRPVELAPLQIYCSAFIFARVMSVERKQFKDCVPQWIRRSADVENNWNACPSILHVSLGGKCSLMPLYTAYSEALPQGI